MAVNSIQLGQVWRSDADGQDYLVTKVYNEVFSQYAMLRPAGITAPDAPTVRVKVTKSPARRHSARLHVYSGRLVLARRSSAANFRYTEQPVLSSQFSVRS